MRRHWSMGVVVAIALAIAVALTSQPVRPALAMQAVTSTEVTLALQSDGPLLRIAHGAFVLTIGF